MSINTEEAPVLVKIHFDITEQEYKEMEPYILNYKFRHLVAYQALIEWKNRKEGRDKKRLKEQLLADKEMLRPIILEILKEEQ